MSFSEDTCCALSLWCLQCCCVAFCRAGNVLGLSKASCHSGDQCSAAQCGNQLWKIITGHRYQNDRTLNIRLLYLPVQCHVVKTLAVHCHLDVCSVTGWHSLGCRTFWVCLQYYTMRWHLMVLQYVAASFHLPSVSTANINTVQYTKPYNRYEIPTNPAVVISKVLLPQSNITAAFVHSHSSLHSDVSPGLPTYSNNNVIQFVV